MVVRVSSTVVRNEWSKLLRQVEYDGETVVVLRSGQAVGALVSMANFERLRMGDVRTVKTGRGWWQRVWALGVLWKSS
ncbi:MAG: type II toxin-antitoxin system Phd/YefM family antitoxin [Paracoccaceae bacterium]